ncbi:MAG: hypothetical protein ACREQI_13680 [Candidatus Binataceae bacterium]
MLCRYFSGNWWCSLFGGYIFGFSPRLVNETLSGHLHVTMVFLVPLAVLTVARAIREGVATRVLVCEIAAILVAQFLISTEVFATTTMFAAMALTFYWLFSPTEIAGRVIEAALSILYAYMIAAVVLTPEIIWLYTSGLTGGEIYPYLAGILSLGDLMFLRPANLLLLAIATAYGWRERRSPAGKTLIASLIAIALFMGGPRFHIVGITLIMPAGIVRALPLIDKTSPLGFATYEYLLLAIMAALWFSSNRLSKAFNGVLAAIVAVVFLPPLSHQPVFPAGSPAFFARGIYRNYLRPGENVMVLPFGFHGNSMLWQAETGMYFRMVGGYTGPHPEEFSRWPIFHAFDEATFLPDAAEQLGAFLAHHQVDAAVVADNEPAAKSWDALFSKFAPDRYAAGGVTVFRILPSAIQQFRQVTAFQMRRLAASTAADTLLVAAGKWVTAGRDVRKLTPFEAVRHGLLKTYWFVGSTVDPYTLRPQTAPPGSRGYLYGGAWLGGTRDGNVKIVELGAYSDLQPIIAHYRNAALHIYFPYPKDLLSSYVPTPSPSQRTYMEMEFTPAQAAAIAAQIRTQ